jgi:hypothetical protein
MTSVACAGGRQVQDRDRPDPLAHRACELHVGPAGDDVVLMASSYGRAASVLVRQPRRPWSGDPTPRTGTAAHDLVAPAEH